MSILEPKNFEFSDKAKYIECNVRKIRNKNKAEWNLKIIKNDHIYYLGLIIYKEILKKVLLIELEYDR